jgi:hypothetical protein
MGTPTYVPTVAMVAVTGSGTSSVGFEGELDLNGRSLVGLNAGFVWGVSADVTVETSLGYYLYVPDSTTLTHTLTSASLTDGSYYVNAVVVVDSEFVYGPTALAFDMGTPTPPPSFTVNTVQAYAQVYDEGVYQFTFQMYLENSETVPDTAVFTFLVSATNDNPSVGGADVFAVAATRELGDTWLASATYQNPSSAAVVYVRGIAQATVGGAVIAADNVLTVQFAPQVTLQLTSVSLPNRTFDAAASWMGFPLGPAPHVFIIEYGYVWTNNVVDPVPTIINKNVIYAYPGALTQPPDYVPTFPAMVTDFGAVGPGDYHTASYVQFATQDGPVEVYSSIISVTVPPEV